MPRKRPRICAVITNRDLEAINRVEPLVDLFEVRIDLIGQGWQEIAREMKKPWLACNRSPDEGGNWKGSEAARISELVGALELGASIVDIELGTKKLERLVPAIKLKAQCLISYHGLKGTPALDMMKEIVRAELEAGADLCKVVTTAREFEDNLAVLQLIRAFPQAKVVAFAMGPLGGVSRVLCPLVGGDFTYASIEAGLESAPGQVTVPDLHRIYEMLADDK